MTFIGSTSPYSHYSKYAYANTAASRSGTGTEHSKASSHGAGSAGHANSATNITLSASAKAALASKSFADVVSDTRTALTDLLKKADSDSPYKNGKLVIDLSGFDRRELYAVASNTDGTFTDDEITAAAKELTARFDQAMSGPAAVYNVTGNITRLYTEALEYLEDASPEEQKSAKWIEKHNAVSTALAELKVSPSTWPEVDNDPVIDYLAREKAGTTDGERKFSTVAEDARAALDEQIADAKEKGEDLLFSKYRKNGTRVDFSDFSSRSLSAIALNEGDQFSAEEMRAAKTELDSRSRTVLLSCIASANKSGSPTALAENIIAAYGSLSTEERTAVGWGEDFYSAALANYKSASYISSILSGNSSLGGASGLPF